jgi:methylisocitrate lyase
MVFQNENCPFSTDIVPIIITIIILMNLIARCKEFRHLLATDCLMVPGCFNGLIARLAAQHGFRALYVSGGALTASSGVPDIGLRSLNEFCSVIKDVSTFSNLPVIADADTGFG